MYTLGNSPTANASGNANFVQNGGTITGDLYGVNIRHNGTGNISLTTNGTVAATSGVAIRARNDDGAALGQGGSITISQAGTATGHTDGIAVLNYGKSSTSITTSGTVSGVTGNGINANNYQATTTDLTITQTAGSISGATNGILANNQGTGVTSVTATGSVTGASGDGIQATNANTGTSVTVAANNVSGSANGINTNNNGTGATNITTTGTISGGTGAGIAATNQPTATDLSITQSSGAISGTTGINAQNFGTGNSTVQISGNVTGTAGSGVDVANTMASGKAVTITQAAGTTVSGTTTGLSGSNAGTGDTTITTAGTVQGGNGFGVYADITNTSSTGNVSINQTGGSISVANTGGGVGVRTMQSGTGSTSVSLAGDVTGYQGVLMQSNAGAKDATFTQAATSHITAQNGGVVITQGGSGAVGNILVNTAGQISTKNAEALWVYSGTNSGTVTVNQASTGNISSLNSDGISVQNNGSGALTVTTAGTVQGGGVGTNGIGVALFSATGAGAATFTQTGGTVAGDQYGVNIRHNGTGNISLTTNGTVTSTSGVAIRARNDNGANIGQGSSITISQAGTATGATDGIATLNYGKSSTTITTAGTVTGTTGNGINANNYQATTTDLTVSQTAGGITGGTNGILANNQGTGVTSVTAAGSVTGTSGDGIQATNASTGTTMTVSANNASGGANGINVTANGSGATNITTSGTISGGVVGSGITATNNGTATDLNITQTGGSVTGGTGISATNNGIGNTTIAVNGNITGNGLGGIGIFADVASTAKALNITQNSGTISGSSGDGIAAITASAGGIAVTQVAGSSIVGGGNGITANNQGTGTTVITSAGTITGGTGAGINTVENAGTTVNITLNSGANVSAASGVGIQDTNGNTTLTLNNGSTVAGKILMGNGNDNVIVNGTANITGVILIDGGNSTDTSGSTTDILGTGTAATNKLSFVGTTQTIAGSIMKNWETVTVNNSTLNFAGDAALVTGHGTNGDNSLQGLVLQNNAIVNSPVALAITGDVNIDATSKLAHDLGGSIIGDVTNAGMIYWNHLNQTLTVNGNYVGAAGSKMSFETYLADDNSATDKMHVTGNTSGTTVITVRPIANSPGAQTINGIQIVQVDGNSAAGSFTLANPLQAGAYQYILKQGSLVAGTSQDWYLVSQCDNFSCTPTPHRLVILASPSTAQRFLAMLPARGSTWMKATSNCLPCTNVWATSTWPTKTARKPGCALTTAAKAPTARPASAMMPTSPACNSATSSTSAVTPKATPNA
jgi:hypothetical protein